MKKNKIILHLESKHAVLKYKIKNNNIIFTLLSSIGFYSEFSETTSEFSETTITNGIIGKSFSQNMVFFYISRSKFLLTEQIIYNYRRYFPLKNIYKINSENIIKDRDGEYVVNVTLNN